METSNKFREKELLDDLRKLVAIPSVRDLSSAKIMLHLEKKYVKFLTNL